uniref:Uncharacterized protein n=1 Tax=Oryza punctata TaxID=4537 RepID=A0A0E0LN68_ORYPU
MPGRVQAASLQPALAGVYRLGATLEQIDHGTAKATAVGRLPVTSASIWSRDAANYHQLRRSTSYNQWDSCHICELPVTGVGYRCNHCSDFAIQEACADRFARDTIHGFFAHRGTR